MATNTKNSRTLSQVADEKMIDGLTKHAQILASLFVNGAPLAVADVIALLQKRIASANNVVLTRSVWQEAVKADRDLRAQTHATVTTVRQGVQFAFAGSPQMLADYGVKPRKSSGTTPQQKVAAAAKAKATRAARHTMGSKQKAQIKGTVEVPVTSLTAPAPTVAATATAGTVAPAATSNAPAAPKPAS